jgi:hypothetical protein
MVFLMCHDCYSIRQAIEILDVDENPGLFADEENNRTLCQCSATFDSATIVLGLFADCPGHSFKLLQNHPTLISLGVFDHTPLQGVGIASLQRQPPPDESVGVAHQSGLF